MDATAQIAHHRGMSEDGTVGEPLQATALAALEERGRQLSEPTELLALATQIDELASQLAHEIASHAADSPLAAPLAPVLRRVPAIRAHVLLRAAERFDDRGSPRRAALVLVEALRRAFGAEVTSIAEALTFTLEAHGQLGAARLVGALITPRDGGDRRAQRAQLLEALDALTGVIDWSALDDELGTD